MEQNNKNSDKIERKVWEIPTIEILNIKQTLGGPTVEGPEDTATHPASL